MGFKLTDEPDREGLPTGRQLEGRVANAKATVEEAYIKRLLAEQTYLDAAHNHAQDLIALTEGLESSGLNVADTEKLKALCEALSDEVATSQPILAADLAAAQRGVKPPDRMLASEIANPVELIEGIEDIIEGDFSADLERLQATPEHAITLFGALIKITMNYMAAENKMRDAGDYFNATVAQAAEAYAQDKPRKV